MKSLSLSRSAVIAASAALAAVASAGIAHAISSNIFQYTNPKTGYFSIGPMALAPDDHTSATRYIINSPNAAFPSAVGTTCFVSGVNLPDNAQLKAITTWYSSDANGGVTAVLYRSNPAVGASNSLGFQTSSDTTQTRLAMTQTLSASALTKINNQHFNYGLRVCLATQQSLFLGARLTYTYAEAGD